MIKVICVDFDGVISNVKWPECGKPNLVLIRHLIERQMLGDKIVLWTCRTGKDLVNAVAFCEKYGLSFDAVNDNIRELKDLFNNNPRKVAAYTYIDDHAVNVDAYTGNKILFRCFSCKYWKYESIDKGHICCNVDSSYVADWTDEKDWCEKWVMMDENDLQVSPLCDSPSKMS